MSVVVLIPAHRSQLEHFERVALERCVDVLRGRPLVVALPADLDPVPLRAFSRQLQFERFAPEYFRSVGDYNRLLLSDEFYARFAAFDYMLIHQLDAFVFRDELDAWCARGYDYLGAPWLPRSRLPLPAALSALRIKQRLYRLLDRRNPDGGVRHAQYDYTVGNGGFSLRRIAALRAALARLGKRLAEYQRYQHYSHGEDIFFCVEANRYRTHVRTPPLRTAVAFAWESQPAVAAQLNGGDLPFGCHGWNRLHREYWRPVFARFGIALDDVLGQPTAATRPERA
jgi:hypothetical protein